MKYDVFPARFRSMQCFCTYGDCWDLEGNYKWHKGIQTNKHCTRIITGICVAHPLLKIITENSYVHLLCTWYARNWTSQGGLYFIVQMAEAETAPFYNPSTTGLSLCSQLGRKISGRSVQHSFISATQQLQTSYKKQKRQSVGSDNQWLIN